MEVKKQEKPSRDSSLVNTPKTYGFPNISRHICVLVIYVCLSEIVMQLRLVVAIHLY